jgi:hypothetical protein
MKRMQETGEVSMKRDMAMETGRYLKASRLRGKSKPCPDVIYCW